MCAFHVCEIAQMITNCAKHLIFIHFFIQLILLIHCFHSANSLSSVRNEEAATGGVL